MLATAFNPAAALSRDFNTVAASINTLMQKMVSSGVTVTVKGESGTHFFRGMVANRSYLNVTYSDTPANVVGPGPSAVGISLHDARKLIDALIKGVKEFSCFEDDGDTITFQFS